MRRRSRGRSPPQAVRISVSHAVSLLSARCTLSLPPWPPNPPTATAASKGCERKKGCGCGRCQTDASLYAVLAPAVELAATPPSVLVARSPEPAAARAGGGVVNCTPAAADVSVAALPVSGMQRLEHRGKSRPRLAAAVGLSMTAGGDANPSVSSSSPVVPEEPAAVDEHDTTPADLAPQAPLEEPHSAAPEALPASSTVWSMLASMYRCWASEDSRLSCVVQPLIERAFLFLTSDAGIAEIPVASAANPVYEVAVLPPVPAVVARTPLVTPARTTTPSGCTLSVGDEGVTPMAFLEAQMECMHEQLASVRRQRTLALLGLLVTLGLLCTILFSMSLATGPRGARPFIRAIVLGWLRLALGASFAPQHLLS